MKTRITLECSCGLKWDGEDIPEVRKRQWDILEILRPDLTERVPTTERTLEYAFRLFWAMHSLSREGRGEKGKHEAELSERISLEESDIDSILTERIDGKP